MRTMRSTLFSLSYLQVAVTVMLAIVPFISATPHPTREGLHFRDPAHQRSESPPSGWKVLGCYTDNPAQRMLTSGGYSDSTGMTVELCISLCKNEGINIFAGLEGGTDCYCGSIFTSDTAEVSNSHCSIDCVGNTEQNCGGSDYLTIYWNGEPHPRPPTIVPEVERWQLEGCYNDSINARTLTVQVTNCVASCALSGYRLAGMEVSLECWCGNIIMNNGTQIDESNCFMSCSGDNSEVCGGNNALIVYEDNDSIQ
ncbi:WSC domain-containing protein [Lactarius quietus]|nr:WSC domain-containing protein [Lactarius quietus]